MDCVFVHMLRCGAERWGAKGASDVIIKRHAIHRCCYVPPIILPLLSPFGPVCD